MASLDLAAAFINALDYAAFVFPAVVDYVRADQTQFFTLHRKVPFDEHYAEPVT